MAVKGLAEENEERIDKKYTQKKQKCLLPVFFLSIMFGAFFECVLCRQGARLLPDVGLHHKPGTPSLGYTVLALCMDVEILSNTLYVKYCLNFTENVC